MVGKRSYLPRTPHRGWGWQEPPGPAAGPSCDVRIENGAGVGAGLVRGLTPPRTQIQRIKLLNLKFIFFEFAQN